MTELPIHRSALPLKIVLGVAALVLVMSTSVGVGLLAHEISDGQALPFIVLVAIPIVVATVAAPMFGLIAAVWPVDPHTRDGRRRFTHLIVVAAFSVVALIVVLTIASTLGLVPVVTAALLGIGFVALTAGSIGAGEFIRRRDAGRPRSAPLPLEDERAELQRKARRIPWTFGIALAVMTATLLTLWIATDDVRAVSPPVVFLGLAFCVIAAGVAALTITIPTLRRSYDLLGADSGRQKRIGRAVRKRSTEGLSHSEQVAARRYAAWLTTIQPFNLAQALLVLLFLLLLRLSNLANPEAGLHGFDIALIAVVVIVPAVAIPLQVRQMRLLKKFASTRDDPASPGSPSTPH